jgi:hypothetical protein
MFTNYKVICRQFSLPRPFFGKFFARTAQFAGSETHFALPRSFPTFFTSAARAGDASQSEQV